MCWGDASKSFTFFWGPGLQHLQRRLSIELNNSPDHSKKWADNLLRNTGWRIMGHYADSVSTWYMQKDRTAPSDLYSNHHLWVFCMRLANLADSNSDMASGGEWNKSIQRPQRFSLGNVWMAPWTSIFGQPRFESDGRELSVLHKLTDEFADMCTTMRVVIAWVAKFRRNVHTSHTPVSQISTRLLKANTNRLEKEQDRQRNNVRESTASFPWYQYGNSHILQNIRLCGSLGISPVNWLFWSSSCVNSVFSISRGMVPESRL